MDSGLENHYRFVKPKTAEICPSAESILKKIEKPLKQNNSGDTSESKFKTKEAKFQNFYHEEILLRDLFYEKNGSDDYPNLVLFLNGFNFPAEDSKGFPAGIN